MVEVCRINPLQQRIYEFIESVDKGQKVVGIFLKFVKSIL